MKKIWYMPLNGGIMGQATGPQPVFLISSKPGNWQLDLSQLIATGNCSPVAISCGPVQLPVFVPVANWTLKHYKWQAALQGGILDAATVLWNTIPMLLAESSKRMELASSMT